ncbi:16S rRNA (guanine(527)-N(7))-methyltransferase RsmG [Rarobacter incanus]|uniref:Ribosomal RNA small subunit methyltransferase G n=1 Tax=Rarobacter incanus TaxID=153494 RepID=A0A542SQ34_9MICO|nr:16S rRNA (guanine(527)-N(7))-methyltransferase RsmG [Rarobacter incanus]TQK76688.1 16S rRNA m(7)G-527 methyltransferase [Rarobacter incanus]
MSTPDGSRDSAASPDQEGSEPAGADALKAFLGDAYEPMQQFAQLLIAHGEERGLIGPREIPRLWDRHLVNCSLLASVLPQSGRIADVGSGAGLPGIVIAIMRPNARVLLVESMVKRCEWLGEVSDRLGLSNVEVLNGRAEEYAGALEADAVTARAVAALDKLTRWAMPLVHVGGEMVVLKGASAEQEIESAQKALRKFAARDAAVQELTGPPGYSDARIVRATRGR